MLSGNLTTIPKQLGRSYIIIPGCTFRCQSQSGRVAKRLLPVLLGRIEVAWLFRLQRQCCYAFVPLCLRAKTETAKQVPARFGKLVELRLNIHGGPAVGFYEPEDDNLVTNSSAKHDTAQHGTALHITAHHITSCIGHFGPGSARMESQTTAPHSRRLRTTKASTWRYLQGLGEVG